MSSPHSVQGSYLSSNTRSDMHRQQMLRSRGFTLMSWQSWHMLPSILSENLCSLRGGVDGLAVSVVWTVDPENDFEILDVWFGRTIIRSKHQLFYAQAQAILDSATPPPAWEITGGREELSSLQSNLLLPVSHRCVEI